MLGQLTILLWKIRNSIVDILHKRWLDSREVVILVIAILVIDLLLLSRLHYAKHQYLENQEYGTWEDNKRYVSYYKKKQYINTIRWLMRTLLFISFILYNNPNIFAGLAIAIWAFVISFGSVFVSLWIYLYLLSFYSPGNYIRVGEITGEIVSITPLYLKLLWRSESGDHTGEFISIPNHKVWQNNVSFIDLDATSVQKNIIDIGYDYDRYHLSFDEFVDKLKLFLDDIFPINTIKTADHYKSYKWYKYKLNFSIDKDNKSIISIWFLCKRSKTHEYKYKIVAFLELLQKEARLLERTKSAKKSSHPEDQIASQQSSWEMHEQIPTWSSGVI